jgi:transcriptional regulator with GAF, ATPase, and Fis domain
MRRLYDTIPAIAESPLCVLILGETGVGKDVLARAIHEHSKRVKGPFVAINCAALPESMLESELFGHVRGAFTGAVQAKVGLFEAAHAGTLFLDEVGELSPMTQAKLLRVVETREVTPLGSVQPKRVDARLVAATNRDLRLLVREGRFREDLFFRIQGVTMEVPPLRERTADVMPLVEHFARATATRLGTHAPRFDVGATAALEGHGWPGNVRELRTMVERVVTLSRGASVLRAEDLRMPAEPLALTMPPSSEPPTERERIVAALARAAGNQKVAAKLLGVSRRTLIRRMEEYGIGRPRKDA